MILPRLLLINLCYEWTMFLGRAIFILWCLAFLPAQAFVPPHSEVRVISCAATIAGLGTFQKMLPSLEEIASLEDPDRVRHFIEIAEQWAMYQGLSRSHFEDPLCCVAFLKADFRICGCCPLKDNKFFSSDLFSDILARLKALRSRLSEIET